MTELKPELKVGFNSILTLSDEDKEKKEKAIARLENDGDGKIENKNWKRIEHSGKGFYCSSAEAIFEEKATGNQYLVSVNTNYGGHSWKSPDYVWIKAVKLEVKEDN
jgi:hypothetical protein